MAKPTILKERGTGEEMYPHTLASLVKTSDGGNVDEGLDKAKRAVFVDMWNNRCKYGNDEHAFGGYLPDEAPDADHPFLLNKIWMTYADAVQTWMLSHNQLGRSSNEGLFGGYGAEAYEKYSKCKTYFPIYCGMSYSAPSLVRAFKGNRIVETLSFVNGYGVVLGVNAELQGAFDGCWNLREILSEIRSPTAFDDYSFRGCRSLTEIRISRLLYNVCFADSPLLSLASFQYLVTNAANTSAITVTVHADVFAKLTGDCDGVTMVITAPTTRDKSAVPIVIANPGMFAVSDILTVPVITGDDGLPLRLTVTAVDAEGQPSVAPINAGALGGLSGYNIMLADSEPAQWAAVLNAAYEKNISFATD